MHRCIKCHSEFKDSEDNILNGCPNCGNKFFEYNRSDRFKEIKEDKADSVETIMIKDNGIYEVNLSPLMEDDSVIISDEEGRYLIDINFLLRKKLKHKK